jgi:hypothetical protein
MADFSVGPGNATPATLMKGEDGSFPGTSSPPMTNGDATPMNAAASQTFISIEIL